MKTVNVDLGERSYPIYIGSNLLASDLIKRHIRAQQVLIVTNETIAPLYLERVKEQLAGFVVDDCILPDGEQYKTWQTLQLIFEKLLASGHTRSTTIVALGGGVIGDMAGFAASCYQRGVRFIQVPTTLLAQVDSSVGGKTAVNHPMGKNMIGAFYQPDAVIADMDTLKTLPQREYAAGVAEVIKYGLIDDSEFFDWLLENQQALRNAEDEALSFAVEKSCITKANVVAKDEKEAGLRAILNLGHTFGHAIETEQGYGSWLHGEAVAAGMVVACKLSRLRDDLALDGEVEAKLEAFLEGFGLPTKIPADMSFQRFMELMAVDKKAEFGKIKLVLLSELGRAVVSSDSPVELIEKALNESR